MQAILCQKLTFLLHTLSLLLAVSYAASTDMRHFHFRSYTDSTSCAGVQMGQYALEI
ncbi:hypothetical protein BCR43DRAFT_492443 [Syncephalastrum racemosum]|uniref:Uncharacterized protein n=1 Tax=Syncephalastrum racemosum TaxID=13706 RepID=A0A1X2HDL6_SYNRA|nr:hypothetical protein BCR43DRAFT_492443 [Syncephalastrum racemosum]